MGAHAGDSVYALLADGATVEIRPAGPGDFDAVRDMHVKMSPDNLYLRFFSMSRAAAEQAARRICREPAPDHAALLAVLDGEVAGYGVYERFGAGSPSAEIALAVADDIHNRGVGTLLLEHLISLAGDRGVRTLVAASLRPSAESADGAYEAVVAALLPGVRRDVARPLRAWNRVSWEMYRPSMTTGPGSRPAVRHPLVGDARA